jgi:hypothetical protein
MNDKNIKEEFDKIIAYLYFTNSLKKLSKLREIREQFQIQLNYHDSDGYM